LNLKLQRATRLTNLSSGSTVSEFAARVIDWLLAHAKP
jgi:hypothetical protein